VGFVAVDRASVFVTDWGAREAPAVLLLHGLGCDAHDWSWQIAPLAKRHRVVALDLVGHGRSSTRPDSYDPVSLARDAAAVLEALGIARSSVIGHSLGAVVASALAVERADLVESLVTFDLALELPEPDRDAAERIAAAIVSGGDASVLDPDYGRFEPGEDEWLSTWRLRRLAGTPAHVVADAYLGLRRAPVSNAAKDWMEYLARRRCPVLAVSRDADLARLDESTFEHPLSRIEVWRGCGHWLHQQRADEANAAILSWLDATAEHA
jgi:pimeloyl-ACP methyl ester carboxylesterase